MSEHPREPRCSRCDGRMEEGFLLETDYGRRGPTEWVNGPPRFGWFNIKLGDSPRYRIQAFRCVRCGGLDQYALRRVY